MATMPTYFHTSACNNCFMFFVVVLFVFSVVFVFVLCLLFCIVFVNCGCNYLIN